MIRRAALRRWCTARLRTWRTGCPLRPCMTVLRRTCLDGSREVLDGRPQSEDLLARGAFKGLKIPVSVVRFRPWAPTSQRTAPRGRNQVPQGPRGTDTVLDQLL